MNTSISLTCRKYATVTEKKNRKVHVPPGVALVNEIKKFPNPHQTIVASATENSATRMELKKMRWLKDPVRIDIGEHYTTPSLISHQILFGENEDEIDTAIVDLVTKQTKLNPSFRGLVFISPTASVNEYVKRLSAYGISAAGLSNVLSFTDLTKDQKGMQDFQIGKVRLLVATEFTSRGFDLPNVDAVIIVNFFFEATSYLHMAGRTGRMGKSGAVHTIITPDAVFKLQSVFRHLSIPFPIDLKSEMQKAETEVGEETTEDGDEGEAEGKDKGNSKPTKNDVVPKRINRKRKK